MNHPISKDKRSQNLALADGRTMKLERPLVMGILNVTPDSFSDGGKFDSADRAVEHALEMVAEGADIIDIGGESTRPGAEPVAVEVEIKRVVPVIEAIRQSSDIPVSIDTYRAETAEAALNAGADMVNDISALRFDPSMAALVSDRQVPVVLMHMQGEPRNMQRDPHYDDCISEIASFFEDRVKFCVANGIDKSKIILDPGIGFGKRLKDNLAIIAELQKFQKLGLPILIGASRKSFIGQLAEDTIEAKNRLGGSIAAACVAALHGASILRVHDVHETVEAIMVVSAIQSCR